MTPDLDAIRLKVEAFKDQSCEERPDAHEVVEWCRALLARLAAVEQALKRCQKVQDALADVLNGDGSNDEHTLVRGVVSLQAKLAAREVELAKRKGMPQLLLECRDALPAISLVAAKLHNVDLTLGHRIEQVLAPWRVADDDPKGV